MGQARAAPRSDRLGVTLHSCTTTLNCFATAAPDSRRSRRSQSSADLLELGLGGGRADALSPSSSRAHPHDNTHGHFFTLTRPAHRHFPDFPRAVGDLPPWSSGRDVVCRPRRRRRGRSISVGSSASAAAAAANGAGRGREGVAYDSDAVWQARVPVQELVLVSAAKEATEVRWGACSRLTSPFFRARRVALAWGTSPTKASLKSYHLPACNLTKGRTLVRRRRRGKLGVLFLPRS